MSEKQEYELRKRFPNLSQEVEQRTSAVRISAVRTDQGEAEKTAHSFQGYEPTVVDYIRRCDTDEQALEIIGFLEAKGEIEPDYVKRLREQLVRHGLRSFGGKKKPGHYI